MSLSRDDVLHVAQLARIALDDAEIETYRRQLSAILDHFDVLAGVDTSEVAPTAQVVALQSVWRDDDVRDSLPVAEALRNAPAVEDGFVRVRPVLE
jgi:aspartyl-tRNA(Asn)/glutamyl-tRNA(Gln) amidotransferase subunit C